MTTESLNVSDFSLVAALAPEGWEVVFHTSYDGTRMALLFCEDEPERALCIYAAAMGVRLAMCEGDFFFEVGGFATEAEAMIAAASCGT